MMIYFVEKGAEVDVPALTGSTPVFLGKSKIFHTLCVWEDF